MVRLVRFESKNSQKWVLKNPYSGGDTTTVSPPSDRKRLYINHLVKFFRKPDFQIFSFAPLLKPDHNLKHPFFTTRYSPRSAFYPLSGITLPPGVQTVLKMLYTGFRPHARTCAYIGRMGEPLSRGGFPTLSRFPQRNLFTLN